MRLLLGACHRCQHLLPRRGSLHRGSPRGAGEHLSGPAARAARGLREARRLGRRVQLHARGRTWRRRERHEDQQGRGYGARCRELPCPVHHDPWKPTTNDNLPFFFILRPNRWLGYIAMMKTTMTFCRASTSLTASASTPPDTFTSPMPRQVRNAECICVCVCARARTPSLSVCQAKHTRTQNTHTHTHTHTHKHTRARTVHRRGERARYESS